MGNIEQGYGHQIRKVFFEEVSISSLDPTNKGTDMGLSRGAASRKWKVLEAGKNSAFFNEQIKGLW